MTDRHDRDEPDGTETIEPESHGVEETRGDAVGSDAATSEDVDAERVADGADVDDLEDESDDAGERVERRSDVVIVTLVFVVLFGYQLYAAISNLVALPEVYAAAGIGDAVPWGVLVAGVAAPAVVFAAASAVARGRRLAARAGLLLLGFGVSAQVSLLLEELARQAAVAAFG